MGTEPVTTDPLERQYEKFFLHLTGHEPYEYQVNTGLNLLAGKNIILRAPTGSGKTWAVLAPFLFSHQRSGPAKLIYALPLRSLAEGIYREAQEIVGKALEMGGSLDADPDKGMFELVTLQTGEQPDDPFFDRGRIIVTTYDQLLSGLLDNPYGLSRMRHNINAAAIVGSLVVFDEFHLMEPEKAFLTGVAGLHLFRNLCQSVWMTATATQPLDRMLREAVDAKSIPDTEEERRRMFEALPCVSGVRRELSVESAPLSPETVLQHHVGRSIVLLNTVGRAQEMFLQLRELLNAQDADFPLILLHSRFFKEDRREKESRLKGLFGKGAKGQAILVATQVVEAGLDLSCEHLHTELCPTNSLVQRAGRCARFEGEYGVVHVYPLPLEDRSWLPYGNLTEEDPTLAGTRELLARLDPNVRVRLNPERVAQWVQEVHGDSDEQRLREGWWARSRECLGRIEQSAIQRDPKRVADLIREDDTASLRIIISKETTLPPLPGRREGLSLSRWSLRPLLQKGAQNIGWSWDAQDTSWKPLETVQQLNDTYVVCLTPEVAAYDEETGLQLGISGSGESPPREEPRRPGHKPLHEESWADHARNVAQEARRRLARDGLNSQFLQSGFQQRYGLSPEGLTEVAVACALLHDLGKLQDGWQRWAEAAQQSRHPGYQHLTPLAHTDFDPDSPEDQERMRALGVRRPSHAAASAYLGRAFFLKLLRSVPSEKVGFIISAGTAAILAHHGGWWMKELQISPPELWPDWETAIEETINLMPETGMMPSLKNYDVEKLLQLTTSAENLREWWPLVAYLTRTLRLSDQRATSEGASHE